MISPSPDASAIAFISCFHKHAMQPSSYCPEDDHMTVAEQIMQHLRALPETAQAEVLDFIEFLESRSNKANWSEFSLSQAMRGMESDGSQYSLDDI